MAGTFDRRIRELEDEVGYGLLTAQLRVNQAYAEAQHERLDYRHTVGQARYLQEPMMAQSGRFMGHLADNAVIPEGSDLFDAMRDVSEWLSRIVENYAPQDTGELYLSGSPRVLDNEVVRYDRPPYIPRGDYH